MSDNSPLRPRRDAESVQRDIVASISMCLDATTMMLDSWTATQSVDFGNLSEAQKKALADIKNVRNRITHGHSVLNAMAGISNPAHSTVSIICKECRGLISKAQVPPHTDVEIDVPHVCQCVVAKVLGVEAKPPALEPLSGDGEGDSVPRATLGIVRILE